MGSIGWMVLIAGLSAGPARADEETTRLGEHLERYYVRGLQHDDACQTAATAGFCRRATISVSDLEPQGHGERIAAFQLRCWPVDGGPSTTHHGAIVKSGVLLHFDDHPEHLGNLSVDAIDCERSGDRRFCDDPFTREASRTSDDTAVTVTLTFRRGTQAWKETERRPAPSKPAAPLGNDPDALQEARPPSSRGDREDKGRPTRGGHRSRSDGRGAP